MEQIFPYANIIIGILVLIVGFIFHWVGQLISIINWEFAKKIGLQDKGQPKEFKVYENAIAKADVLIGWIYGIIGVGLILDLSWSYKLLWIPGVILIYHGISYWYWASNQKKIGINIISNKMQVAWTIVNLIPGILAVIIAWYSGQ